MYTYNISGQVNYNEAETDDGNATVEINETIEVKNLGAHKALIKFFEENPQYDNFFVLETCDTETRGEKGATFIDSTDQDRRLNVDLVNE